MRAVKYITNCHKIHFALFNLVVIDIVFIGTRTLLHVNITKDIGYLYLWTVLIFTLLILDVIEITVMQFSLGFDTYKKLRVESVQLDPND